MKKARFSLVVLLATFSLLAAYALCVLYIDPFCQYHLPVNGLSPDFNRKTQTYLNAGYAKNADYDAVVLGSSVAENFYASQFSRRFGCKAIKLPSASAYSKDYAEILNVVFREHDVKYVFYSLDGFAYWNEPDAAKHELPLYLYDNNPLNDVEYLLNIQMIRYMDQMLANRRNNQNVALDDAYNWHSGHTFSEKNTLEKYTREDLASTEKSPEYYMEKTMANMANMVPFIEAHPETTFYVFFPPYSILWWDSHIRSRSLDGVFNSWEYLMEEYLRYDNVRLFFFQNIPEIQDLNNYRESMHFSEELNAMMVDAMAAGAYEVRPETISKVLADMRKTVEAFDFSVFFDEA